VVAAVNAAVALLPFAASGPVQPPVPVQAVALEELHVSSEAPPLFTAVGFAVNIAVGTTLTVALAGALVPPTPVHVRVNKEFELTGAVVTVPIYAFVPLQLAEAVQLVALVELQVNVDVLPLTTVAGAAVSVAVGTGTTVTVVVTAGLVPPAPVQVSVKLVVAAVSVPVLFVPLVANVPVQAPEAVQAVALVELHVNVVAPPLAMLVADAVNVAAGTEIAAADTVTVAVAAALLPPAPVQFNEYVVLAVRAPVLWVPLAANVPVQPPDAVHPVALVELQVRVAAPPLVMLVGEAANTAVGVGTLAGVTSTVTDLLAVAPPDPVHSSEYVVF